MNDDVKEKIKAYYVANDIDEIIDYITNLQQENERLNHQLEVQKELTERNRLRKHCYKTRIEKAVEYIKINFVEDIITVKTLLNILNGSDE